MPSLGLLWGRGIWGNRDLRYELEMRSPGHPVVRENALRGALVHSTH